MAAAGDAAPGASASNAPPAASSGSAPGQVAPLGAILSDPSALQEIIGGALAGAAASLGTATGGELGPIREGIKLKAQRDAKGMQAEGELMSARLKGNSHAEAALTLYPGVCYTVIGFGGLGVVKFRINLISAPPAPPQVLAQSSADSVDPSVGANDACIKNPLPLPMPIKVDLHLIEGQGLVGAQVYRR